MADTIELEGIPALVHECLLKTRGIDANELNERYTKLCNKRRVLPLWGQVQTALKRLLANGLIRTNDDKSLVWKN